MWGRDNRSGDAFQYSECNQWSHLCSERQLVSSRSQLLARTLEPKRTYDFVCDNDRAALYFCHGLMVRKRSMILLCCFLFSLTNSLACPASFFVSQTAAAVSINLTRSAPCSGRGEYNVAVSLTRAACQRFSRTTHEKAHVLSVA